MLTKQQRNPYIWDYNIKIKTKNKTYEYELETLEKIQEIIDKHPEYEEVSAKKLVKKKENRNERSIHSY